MNKSELVEAVAAAAGLERKQAEAAVSAFAESVVAAARSGENVSIFGFGTFKPTARKARTGRNPQNGEPVKIAASKGVKFQPSSAFKVLLNSKKAPAKKAALSKAAAKKTATNKAPATRATAAKATAAKATASKATASKATAARPAASRAAASRVTAAKATSKAAARTTAAKAAARTTAARAAVKAVPVRSARTPVPSTAGTAKAAASSKKR